MKSIIITVVLCVFAYSGVGAILKTANAEKEHIGKIDEALALASK